MAYRGFLPAVFFGVATILVVALSFSFVVSIVLKFTSFTEQSFYWVILVTAFLAMFIGGLVSGAKAREKGWMAGAVTALLFSVLTFLIQYLGYNNGFSIEQYMFHGGYLFAAACGGIIGVNISGSSSNKK
ncbi:TIGR04086 family membrane protein [Bacillus solitudinis]|uniref:TIGR04086 family membrane protein n=1 Tax=Bacillus solitudinis TaxID=2014074 RepID=UPI000C2400DE|nr:TIGR04086 family membrane protein [Bacillus solitudinis]